MVRVKYGSGWRVVGVQQKVEQCLLIVIRLSSHWSGRRGLKDSIPRLSVGHTEALGGGFRWRVDASSKMRKVAVSSTQIKSHVHLEFNHSRYDLLHPSRSHHETCVLLDLVHWSWRGTTIAGSTLAISPNPVYSTNI